MGWVPVVSSIFVLVGAAMLIAAGREFTRRRAFLRSSATVSGTIIALTETRERDEIGYFPKVDFHTPSGRGITFQSAMGSSTAAKRVHGWWWCRGPDGREGWVPAEFLAIEGGEATVSREYDAHELSVSTGEDVEVLEDIAGGLASLMVPD